MIHLHWSVPATTRWTRRSCETGKMEERTMNTAREPVSIDLLIAHATIVTMDDALRTIHDGAIAIRKGEIIEVGSFPEMCGRYAPALTLDAGGRFATPGLINTHTHGGDVLFRGLVEDLPLEPWLQRLWKTEKEFISAESVYWGAQLSYLEMIKAGITTAADMFWHPESMLKAAQRIGLRLVSGPVFFDPAQPDEVWMNDQVALALDFIREHRDDPLFSPCLQPHSVYTVSPGYLEKIGSIARAENCLIATHASETRKEVQDCNRCYGRSPIQHLESLGLLSGDALLAHCVYLDAQDLEVLAERNVVVSHCPVSNLKIASGIADIAAMLAKGIQVTLGTDGPVSGNDLNPWLTMRLAAMLQKTTHSDPSLLGASQVLGLMTRQAAQGLGLNQSIGSLEAGKRADILIIDQDQAHAVPAYDAYACLVYSIGREDVNSVIIDGRVIMEDRKLLTLDEQEVKVKVKEYAERIKVFSGI